MEGKSTNRRLTVACGSTALICALSLAACGGSTKPLGGSGGGASGGTAGFPTAATKNTTRLGSSTTAGNAAAASLAVWPGGSQHPSSVAFIPANWQTALAAAPLTTPPFNSALLLADGEIPEETSAALKLLAPTGVPSAGGVKRIVVGDAEDPGESKRIDANGPAALADAVDRSRLSSGAAPSDSVVVVGTSDPAWAAPAAAWAARSGDPILFANRDAVPKETIAAIQRRGRPLIMLLAPASVVSSKAESELNAYGAVARITGADPTDSSIQFARFRDGDRGWGIVDPGHGLMFGVAGNELAAIMAAPLSGAGQWPPLLMLPEGGSLPKSLDGYLRDIQPGYRGDPTRSLYNRGWLVGDTESIPDSTQAKIDWLLSMAPANESARP